MSSRHILLASTCAAAIAMATAANADTVQPAAADTGVTHQIQTAAADKDAAQRAKARNDVRAETLIDQSVTNFEGDTVGDIESVIVGPSGKVRAVVVGVGGFLGMGERLVALDWDELEISDNGDTVRVAATAEELKALPAYTYDDEARRGTTYEDERFVRAADRASDRAERGAERAAERAESGAERAAERSERDVEREEAELEEAVAVDTLMDSRGNIKTSELIGMDIVNRDGEVVGDIEEILLTEDGKITAVIGAGGVLGIGETRLLVNWSGLEIHKSGDQAQIRTVLSKEDLQKLPQN